MDPRMMEFEDQIMDCTRQVDSLYSRFARAKGLTYMSLLVLDCICDHPAGCTQKEICEQTYYPRQSINLIVKNFLEQGYVQLEELPEDRRNKRITLTESGKRRAEETVFPFWNAEDAAFSQLTDSERAQFLDMMKRFTASLTQSVEALLDGADPARPADS